MISIVIISKDEADLDDTISDAEHEVSSLAEGCEIVVIDASSHRLDYIRRRLQGSVRWLDFEQPPGVRVSIPHQRNVGVREARGDIIVFTDAGCRLSEKWLARMVAPLRGNESVVAGILKGLRGKGLYEISSQELKENNYLRESPTLNFAFRREVYDAVGEFDENFTYGSDIDFCWRLNDLGYRIRRVPDAVVLHDWGTSRRQRRRSYLYGKARAHLYRKHRSRRARILRDDPIAVVYPLFLLGLPLTLVFPLYPLLLLIPAWRNRSEGMVQVLVDHLWFGAGVLAELMGI
jgi:cellulose synthase/poly-beta-1,6-N-acetylglucosamine synthase-like glycosyltransferase